MKAQLPIPAPAQPFGRTHTACLSQGAECGRPKRHPVRPLSAPNSCSSSSSGASFAWALPGRVHGAPGSARPRANRDCLASTLGTPPVDDDGQLVFAALAHGHCGSSLILFWLRCCRCEPQCAARQDAVDEDALVVGKLRDYCCWLRSLATCFSF